MGHRVHGTFKRQGKLPAVLLAALLAAVVAVAMIGRPADAEVSNASIEAETMGFSSSLGEVVTDGAASGGKAVALYRNGSLSGQFDGNHNRIVVRARGDRCNGGPRMEVKVDGVRVLSQEVRSTTWADYPASITPKSGQHTLTVAFTNDYANRSCDRNLRVDKASLSGATTSVDTGTTTPAQPLLFSDGFERDADEFVPPWSWMNRAQTDRLTTSTAVARKGTQSAKFTVRDGDVAPLTVTSNPRAQINSPKHFCEGDDRWIGSSVQFPSDFPNLPSGGWVVVREQGFASPYSGSPAASFVLRSPGNELLLVRDESYNRDVIWRAPLKKGEWMDVVTHTKFSRNASVGYMELWLNGQRQTFSDGQQRIYYPTLERESTGCGDLELKNYRLKGMFESATVYHDEVKIGSSYAAVAP